MTKKPDIKILLATQFQSTHINAILSHYSNAVSKYQSGDWEGALLKSGKFVEAVMKALLIHCALSLPPPRRFKVSSAVINLGQLSNSTDDAIRLLIPRACIFIYDIVSNRGARHDPDKIDPNKIDASVVMPTISWILAEMIRFSSGVVTPQVTIEQIESLVDKKYPHIEYIDGRLYINTSELKPRELGLLLLHAYYPKRITRSELSASIYRHGIKRGVTVALTRLKSFVDENDDGWRLRQIGVKEAEKIFFSL